MNFVDGEGFKELMAYVATAYVILCTETMKNRLDYMYSAAKQAQTWLMSVTLNS